MNETIKFSFEQKLFAVRSVISGKSSTGSAAKSIGSDKSSVKHWVRFYEAYGSKGLKLKNRYYSGSYKLNVVTHMLKNRLSLIRTAVLFAIPYPQTIGKWRKIYIQHGAKGLNNSQISGTKKSVMPKKSKKPAASGGDPEVKKLEALQKEVKYLRAENAFLKKLDALIQQEKAEKEKRQKPSRN